MDTREEEKWVYDSSVDYKGNVPLRSKTGAWRAALFILVIEFSERLSYFGLATNLIIYLTKVLHQDVKTAAKSVNYWIGVTTMMPLIGGFVADSYLGRFSMVLLSSLVYLVGLMLLTLSRLIPSLKPCNTNTCTKILKRHEVIFFIAIYMISIGTGGHKPSLESFGADQFDDNNPAERKKKMSYFNWWNCGVCGGLILGVTVIVYIQDNVSWAVADVILALLMCISVAILLSGRKLYRYRNPKGSPLTPMLQVLVAAYFKRKLPYPSNYRELYEVSLSQKIEKRLLSHTDKIRFLDKAAIIENKNDEIGFTTEKQNKWRLATVTQIEEVKLVLSIIPIWLATLPFGMCVAQTSTFFIKQGSIMNRTITKNFEIPPASLYSFAAIIMIMSVSFYDKVLVPSLRKITKNERGVSILQRIGIGMVLAVLAMIVSAVVEHKRLRSQSLLSVFWLVPQFMILGIGDAFTIVGLQEYFYDQVPDSMRSLGIAIYLSVMGASNFLTIFLINLVDVISKRGGGGEGWIGKDLNKSRLDLFYWILAAINGLNLGIYAYLAAKYSYKKVLGPGQGKVGVATTEVEYENDNNRITV